MQKGTWLMRMRMERTIGSISNSLPSTTSSHSSGKTLERKRSQRTKRARKKRKTIITRTTMRAWMTMTMTGNLSSVPAEDAPTPLLPCIPLPTHTQRKVGTSAHAPRRQGITPTQATPALRQAITVLRRILRIIIILLHVDAHLLPPRPCPLLHRPSRHAR